MKKSTIIIISIVSAAIVLGCFTAFAVFALQKFSPLIDKELQQKQQNTNEEDVNAKKLKDIASKHGAAYWADSLKTNYSYEMIEKIKALAGKKIVFRADLNDIVQEGSSYTAIYTDKDIVDAPYSIVYRLKCTGSQVDMLTKLRTEIPKDGYVFFITAADIEGFVEVKSKDNEIWGPPLTIYGSLLESVRAEPEVYDSEY